jgi:hypothetical protein
VCEIKGIKVLKRENQQKNRFPRRETNTFPYFRYEASKKTNLAKEKD